MKRPCAGSEMGMKRPKWLWKNFSPTLIVILTLVQSISASGFNIDTKLRFWSYIALKITKLDFSSTQIICSTFARLEIIIYKKNRSSHRQNTSQAKLFVSMSLLFSLENLTCDFFLTMASVREARLYIATWVGWKKLGSLNVVFSFPFAKMKLCRYSVVFPSEFTKSYFFEKQCRFLVVWWFSEIQKMKKRACWLPICQK